MAQAFKKKRPVTAVSTKKTLSNTPAVKSNRKLITTDSKIYDLINIKENAPGRTKSHSKLEMSP
jgi:hypothetical protein